MLDLYGAHLSTAPRPARPPQAEAAGPGPSAPPAAPPLARGAAATDTRGRPSGALPPSKVSGESRRLQAAAARGEALPEGCWVQVDLGRGSENDIPARCVFPLGAVTWRGRQFPAPGAVEDALEWRYGPTWRVPRYLDKGRDTHESKKPYYRLLKTLGRFGLRF